MVVTNILTRFDSMITAAAVIGILLCGLGAYFLFYFVIHLVVSKGFILPSFALLFAALGLFLIGYEAIKVSDAARVAAERNYSPSRNDTYYNEINSSI